MKITSRKQQRFLGAVASGRLKRKGGPSKRKAALLLAENRGIKLRNLPERSAKARPARRSARR